jgi:predicted ATP-grasp superfamily ATP-dependent carboligase
LASSSTDLKPESRTSPEQEGFGPLRTVRSLLLCGASVRSLAESVIAAGIRPLCVDFFEDEDLSQLLNRGRGRFVGRISSFAELPTVIHSVRRSIPLLWAGGLENHTSVLRQIAQQRPVIGAEPDRVDQIRNPYQLMSWLSNAGLLVPRTASEATADVDLVWLRKPVDSSGGLGIRSNSASLVRSDSSPVTGLSRAPLDHTRHYLQEYIDGVPMSAVFCSDGRRVTLIGSSLQLVGWPSLGSSDFHFCGNLGPVDPGESVTSDLLKAGQTLVDQTGIRGMFGIDFVLRMGTVWFLEVNPRFTASHMIYEPSSGLASDKGSLVSRHLASLGWRSSSRSAQVRRASCAFLPTDVHARFILWATEDYSVPEDFAASFSDAGTFVKLADIPAARSTVTAGSPICSVHVSAASLGSLQQTLEGLLSTTSTGFPCSWSDVCQQLSLLLDRLKRNLPPMKEISTLAQIWKLNR